MSTVKSANFQHPNATNPAIVLAADGSATANVSAINGGPLAGMRNAIINGNFDFWQRGTSFTGSEYGADRWIHGRTGTTHTASRQAFTLGQTDVPGEPTYFCRTVVSSVAGVANNSALDQRIEDVRTFAGQQVTLSFWAKADAAKPVAVETVQVFGSGGSPSASVTGAAGKFNLTTAWQKISTTITLPSIAGKTLGSDNNSFLVFRIWFDAGSDFNSRTDTLGQQSGTFDIAQVQVEAGPVATPFERRPIGTELALCQRYFCKSYNLDTPPGTVTNAGYFLSFAHNAFTLQQGNIRWPVPMRGVPTTLLYSSVTGASGVIADVVANVDRVVNLVFPGQNGAEVNANATLVSGNYHTFHFSASAEL